MKKYEHKSNWSSESDIKILPVWIIEQLIYKKEANEK